MRRMMHSFVALQNKLGSHPKQEFETNASTLPLAYGMFVQKEGQTQSGVLLASQSLPTNVRISLGFQIRMIPKEV
jgi:hypothetical protein